MFAQLNTLLHLQPTLDDRLNILILDELNADGSFLISHFLSTFLRHDNMRACLLSFSQLLVHYALIGKRMGMTLLDNPNFQFIDGISRLTMDVVLSGNLQGQNPCIEAEEELVRAAKQFSITATDPSMMIGQGRTVVNQFALSPDMAAARQPLSGLIGTIHEFIDESTATGKRPCLLIDDLGLLLNIGIDPRELHHFLSHLHLAMEKANGHLVVLMHADGYQMRNNVTVIIDELSYSSHYILRSQAFVSGQSAELDGEISLERGPMNRNTQFTGQTLHYKLTESSLKLFGKGLSTAVI